MASVEAALKSWSKDIEPTVKQKEAASRSYRHLLDVLSRREVGDRIVDCYLSGSYRRNTALRPIGDIDVIFVIDPRQWPGALLGLADKPNPSAVLRSFARVLRDEYPSSSTFTQKRSLRLELGHLHIDCVPAITRPGNTANGGLLVPLVKLLKDWISSLPEDARIRSFVVETLAVTLFRNVHMRTLEEGLYLFLDFLAHFEAKAERTWPSKLNVKMNVWDGMFVPDLAGTGGNVAAGIELKRMKALKRHAVASRDSLQRAFKAKTSAAAVEHLRVAMKD